MTDLAPDLDARLVFVVGARRSGTHLLHRLLATHPLVRDIPGETHLFSSGVGPLVDRLQSAGPGSPTVGTAYLPRPELLAHVRALTDRVLSGYLPPGTPPQVRLLERTPQHVHRVALLAELYPQAHIVHIVRDGLEVVRSLVAQSWGPDEIPEAAAEWRDAVLDAHRQRPAVTHWVDVRYERLRAAPRAELARVLAALGLPVDDAVLDQVAHEAARRENVWGATKPDLRRRDRRQIRRVAAEAFALLDDATAGQDEPTSEPLPVGTAPDTTTIASVHDSQHAVDQLLEIVHGARPADRLATLLAAGATFHLVTGDDETTFRGADAAAQWLAAVQADDSVRWEVERSWAHPDLRLVAAVVVHRRGAVRQTRTHVARLGPQGITEVTTHVEPRHPPTRPARTPG